MVKKFFMVYGIGQGPPSVEQRNRIDAEREAKRLAAKCPGVTFVVLEAVDAFIFETVRRVEVSPEEVPF